MSDRFDEMIEKAANWSETGDLDVINRVRRASALGLARACLEAAGVPELLEENERYRRLLAIILNKGLGASRDYIARGDMTEVAHQALHPQQKGTQ